MSLQSYKLSFMIHVYHIEMLIFPFRFICPSRLQGHRTCSLDQRGFGPFRRLRACGHATSKLSKH